MHIWPIQWLKGQPLSNPEFIFSRQVRYQFTETGGMKGLVGLSWKPESRIWSRVHAAADTSSECATTLSLEAYLLVTNASRCRVASLPTCILFYHSDATLRV